MSRRDYGSSVFNSGGKPPGILKPTITQVSTEKRKEMQATWKELKKDGGDVMLPYGVDYVSIGFKPDEIEFLQSGNFSVATVSRWFGVPRHKLFDPEGGSYNSNEQAAIEFLSDTMAPILSKIEYEYSSKIYQLPREQRYYLEFDMNAYVRPDTQTRYEAYAKAIHAAIMEPAEARQRENLPFAEGSNQLFINSGSIPVRLMEQFVLKKSQQQALTDEKKAKLKELLNGKTDDAIKIIES